MTAVKELTKLVKTQLSLVTGGTYHRIAPDDAAMPYKIFSIARVNLGDLERDDFELQVDIYDHNITPRTVEDIADAVEEKLHCKNLPQTTFLPTFYRDTRYPIEEPDKLLQHERVIFTVQSYSVPAPPAQEQTDNDTTGGND